jgi:uncharacterized SAM-binding protein YcdF (DUF218 family)
MHDFNEGPNEGPNRGRYDAAIVLANLMDAQGRLNDETRARMDCAIALYRAGDVPLIVTSGWDYRDDSDLPIALAMRRYAMEAHGIPEAALIAETTARDTVGDAVFTKLHLALPRGWSRVAVVTSAYHGARSLEVFSFVYGPRFEVALRTAVSDDTPALREAEARSIAAFRGTFDGVAPGDDAAIFARLRERHPFYNGSVYSALPAAEIARSR